MKRRDTFKSLLIAGIAGSTILTSCEMENAAGGIDIDLSDQPKVYGRTPSEIVHDDEVHEDIFLTEYELGTISVLCDMILPATATAGSAVEAKVPEFIEFIVKDLPGHQIPIRGGLMWLDGESNSRYEKSFVDLSEAERVAILDDIAYPDPDEKSPEMNPGRTFFSRLRNLTLTGYYTTKMGIDDLGYIGNVPNMWDGPPQDVLDKHGLSYEESWVPKFIDHESREVLAEWDDEGNLLT